MAHRKNRTPNPQAVSWCPDPNAGPRIPDPKRGPWTLDLKVVHRTPHPQAGSF